MQAQHQMITGQISPQQMQTQILVTSMGQQQMLPTMVTQVQQQQPTPHQMAPSATPHLGTQHQPQQTLQQQQQTQQHQMMTSTQILQQQNQGQHSLNTQQNIGHSPGFAHPGQPHMPPNPNYQQSSPHRPTMTRYPTPSPENMQHGTPPICTFSEHYICSQTSNFYQLMKI